MSDTLNYAVLPLNVDMSKRILDVSKSEKPIKLIIQQYQSPGDLVMLTAAIRDLHLSYPGWFQTDVRTPCAQLWENNPYITKLEENSPGVIKIHCEYNLIHNSNEGCHHFIHGFIQDLNQRLGIQIQPTKLKGDIHLSEEEKSWYSQVYEIVGKDIPYWIINAGCKTDFTCKLWELSKFQQVVDQLPDITFVQIGESGHRHEPLQGDNVINLIGKTDLRQLIRLVYHSAGCITPVSLLMHLSAAVEVHSRFDRKTRPTVVLAGGREPSIWEAYTNHAFIHHNGKLRCCDSGGCWCSRVYRNQIGDNDEKDRTNLCKDPVKGTSGQMLPRCMDMISVEDVVRPIRQYLETFNFYKELDLVK